MITAAKFRHQLLLNQPLHQHYKLHYAFQMFFVFIVDETRKDFLWGTGEPFMVESECIVCEQQFLVKEGTTVVVLVS